MLDVFVPEVPVVNALALFICDVGTGIGKRFCDRVEGFASKSI